MAITYRTCNNTACNPVRKRINTTKKNRKSKTTWNQNFMVAARVCVFGLRNDLDGCWLRYKFNTTVMTLWVRILLCHSLFLTLANKTNKKRNSFHSFPSCFFFLNAWYPWSHCQLNRFNNYIERDDMFKSAKCWTTKHPLNESLLHCYLFALPSSKFFLLTCVRLSLFKIDKLEINNLTDAEHFEKQKVSDHPIKPFRIFALRVFLFSIWIYLSISHVWRWNLSPIK